jgi:hypothetical protein
MEEKRDSMVFYRSFYEAIKELSKEQQGEIYNAIFSYGLDFDEPELKGISKTVWTLIKPQIDANIRRYNNGNKPKNKQNISKTEAKPKQEASKTQANDNVNDNVNVNKQIYRAFAHLSLSITDYEKLEAEYDKRTIDMVLDSIENYKKNNTYKSLYLTAKKWLSKELKKKSIIESDEWEQDFKLGDVMPNGATLTADVISHHQQTGLSYKRLAGL